MLHPLQSILDSKSWWVFWTLILVSLILVAVVGAIPQNPSILQLELAGSVSAANQILDAWGKAGQIQAAFSLGLAFLAIITYSTTLSLTCVWSAKVSKTYGLPLVTVGVLIAWGQWLAGLFDLIVDITLVLMLFNSVTEPLPQIALWCAVAKFSLLILGLLYTGFGVILKTPIAGASQFCKYIFRRAGF